MKPFTTIAAAIFALVALVHLYRLATGFEVVIGGKIWPAWPSVVGLLLGALLAVMLWREARR